MAPSRDLLGLDTHRLDRLDHLRAERVPSPATSGDGLAPGRPLRRLQRRTARSCHLDRRPRAPGAAHLTARQPRTIAPAEEQRADLALNRQRSGP